MKRVHVAYDATIGTLALMLTGSVLTHETHEILDIATAHISRRPAHEADTRRHKKIERRATIGSTSRQAHSACALWRVAVQRAGARVRCVNPSRLPQFRLSQVLCFRPSCPLLVRPSGAPVPRVTERHAAPRLLDAQPFSSHLQRQRRGFCSDSGT